ncbi:MAG: insulinase family protein [Deltaproteobacteria bacterium]|nr:insulinase family protein [Deltaproteobacteria bacterium]
MIKPQKHILPNGMTLLLIESHQNPVVSFNACFRVGSVVESEKEAGICHYIEHMIFKGTPKRPAGQIAGAIEAAGGEINAYTSFDETVYYCTLSSRYFDEGLDILSDAILNPLFDAVEMEREKPVIIEEMNRSYDSPGKVLSESLFKTVYQVHGYGRPIIGSKESVMAFTQEDLQSFYHRWYVPQNLVFVVSGNFDSKTALEKIKKIFANYSDQAALFRIEDAEPEQTHPRLTINRKNFEGHYVQLAFPIPSLSHGDLPALDLLSHLLGEGLSSRLEQHIKEKKGLVDSIYSYAYTPKSQGLFVVGFTTQEKKVIKAIKEIIKELFTLEHNPISHAELARARLNIKSDAFYERETVEGIARKYGYFETTLGDYLFDKKYYQKIDEVDPDELHEVAEKYFVKEKINFSVLVPEKSKLREGDFNIDALWSEVSSKAKKVMKSAPEIKTYTLKNGIRLLFKQNQNLPLVSLRLSNLGGLRYENPKNNGAHHLFAQVFTKGTQKQSAEEIAFTIENLGANIDAFSGRNADGLQGDFLSEKLDDSLDLFFELLLEPKFDTKEIEKERALILQAIKREEDQLASLAYKRFLKDLYPQHPYGLPAIGTEKTVKSLKRKDLLEIHQTMLNPKAMVLSMVGDFDPETYRDFFEKKLSPLKSRMIYASPFNMPQAPAQKIESRIPKDKMQTHIVLGFLGTSIYNKDRYAMEVLNHILAGQGGRLFMELRDKQSLAYSVTSFSQEGLEPGFFAVYIATEPQKAEQAIAGIKSELKKIQSEKVSPAELERAKKHLIGTFEIDLQRNSHLNSQLAFNELYGLGYKEIALFPDKVLKVTENDILKVAQKYFDLDRYVLAVLGGKE